MSSSLPSHLVLVMLALSAVTASAAEVVAPTSLRPTDIVVKITNDSYYDGVYRGSGFSRSCGKFD